MLLTASDDIRLYVDPGCSETIRDIEGTVWRESGSRREIDKTDMKRSHWVDALKDWAVETYPVDRAITVTSSW